jgi:Family of unknown function (DUF6519)
MQGEYRGDFTRDTFSALKHFSRVLAQQGRVQLDADPNEQAAILLHYLRNLARDLIGDRGCPATGNGFQAVSKVDSVTLSDDFGILEGHYYVGGILCELESTPVPLPALTAATTAVTMPALLADGRQLAAGQYIECFDANNNSIVFTQITDVKDFTVTFKDKVPANAVSLRRVTTYFTQPDYPAPRISIPAPGGDNYVAYLDVWERHITHVEDDSIREVALGGPDTATRAKVVWQVRVFPTTLTVDDLSPAALKKTPATWQKLVDVWQPPNRGRLKAKATGNSTSSDPCAVAPRAQFRGLENQLYRVEIHRGGSAWDSANDAGKKKTATFKWSRENASVNFPIRTIAAGSAANTSNIVLEYLGKDDQLGLAEGDWVELVNDETILLTPSGTAPAPLQDIQAISSTEFTVTVAGPPLGVPDLSKHPLLRRWDYKETAEDEGGLQLADDNAAVVVESSSDWLSLEDGVQIQFQPGATYRTGDYWLIPARTATGDVEWPTEQDSKGNRIQVALAPHGIQHYYAPLQLLDSKFALIPSGDLRSKFSSLVDLTK